MIARQFLEEAYEELRQDSSIPEDSIYRTLIPRTFGRSIFFDVKNELGDLSGGENGNNSKNTTLRSNALGKLQQSLVLLIEAGLAMYSGKPGWGDINIGFSPKNSVRDIELCVDLLEFSHDQFGRLPIDYHTHLRSNLEKLIADGREFFKKNQIPGDLSEKFDNLVWRLQTLLQHSLTV